MRDLRIQKSYLFVVLLICFITVGLSNGYAQLKGGSVKEFKPGNFIIGGGDDDESPVKVKANLNFHMSN